MGNNFCRPKEASVEKFEKTISELKESYEEVLLGKYSFDELLVFLEKLVKTQDKNGFWGLVNPKETQSDAVVDFFYIPTYYSTAILIKLFLDYPKELAKKDGFLESLKKGLIASTGRQLRGHGYDDISGMIEAMEIFCLAGLGEFITRYSTICPKFTKMIAEIFEYAKASVEKGKIKGEWGEDYHKGLTNIIECLTTNNGTKHESKINGCLIELDAFG